MTAGLDGQGAVHPLGVELQGLVDDVFIPPLVPVVPAPQGTLDVLLEAVGGDGVGDDGAPGAVLQGDGGGQGHQPVAVDLLALPVYGAAPVHVGIEDDA